MPFLRGEPTLKRSWASAHSLKVDWFKSHFFQIYLSYMKNLWGLNLCIYWINQFFLAISLAPKKHWRRYFKTNAHSLLFTQTITLNRKVSTLFIDFSNAFDLVRHDDLQTKLGLAGIKGPIFWFQTFVESSEFELNMV